MIKYYADKERAFPFNLVYNVEMNKLSIEQKDFLEDLFKNLLLEIDGRITGNYLLLEKEIGSPLDMDSLEEEDLHLFENCEEEIIYDEKCKLIVKKRIKALATFGEAIELLYKMFYNTNQKELENLIKDFQRR